MSDTLRIVELKNGEIGVVAPYHALVIPRLRELQGNWGVYIDPKTSQRVEAWILPGESRPMVERILAEFFPPAHSLVEQTIVYNCPDGSASAPTLDGNPLVNFGRDFVRSPRAHGLLEVRENTLKSSGSMRNPRLSGKLTIRARVRQGALAPRWEGGTAEISVPRPSTSVNPANEITLPAAERTKLGLARVVVCVADGHVQRVHTDQRGLVIVVLDEDYARWGGVACNYALAPQPLEALCAEDLAALDHYERGECGIERPPDKAPHEISRKGKFRLDEILDALAASIAMGQTESSLFEDFQERLCPGVRPIDRAFWFDEAQMHEIAQSLEQSGEEARAAELRLWLRARAYKEG